MNISIFANTGIQFHTEVLDLGTGASFLKERLEFVFPMSADHLGMESVQRDPETGQPHAANQLYAEDSVVDFSAQKALGCFEGHWLPLPYFRATNYTALTGQDFKEGPMAWARLWFRKTGDAKLNVVLAFDTSLPERAVNQAAYLSLVPEDVGNAVYAMAHSLNDVACMLSVDAVGRWISDVFLKEASRINYRVERLADDSEEGYKTRQEMHGYAMYLCLLKCLSRAGAFKPVQLLAVPTSTASGSKPVFADVDLVLDIGNSRSCGLLLETVNPQHPFDFRRCSQLAIRDLGTPDVCHTDPFPMMVEFCRPDFGVEEATARAIGWEKAFQWPSPVRVGHEAQRRSILDSSSYPTGLSSPKRYLWDDRPRVDRWVYNGSERAHANPSPVFDALTTLVDSKGDFIPEGDISRLNAQDPHYSRKSLMFFAFTEIILHAVSQMNSFAHRSHHDPAHIPRRLRRVVVTCPTAMTLEERYRLRQLVQDATRALRRLCPEIFFGAEIEVMPSPAGINPQHLARGNADRTEWSFDEATCVQLLYLYGEIYDGFGNHAARFFETMGSRKTLDGKPGAKPSLTLASLDIGGGTTDLMICNYQQGSEQNGVTVLSPRPLFWEGFNKAGDNILKAIVERIVFKGLKQACVDAGLAPERAADLLTELFGSAKGGTREQVFRRRFATEAALPMAEGCLEFLVQGQESASWRFSRFFENRHMPHAHTLEHLNRRLRASGLADFDIRNVSWQLQAADIDDAIRDVMEGMLHRLCSIVAQFGCDILLLAGRPSALPTIQDMIRQRVPVRPGRIVCMGNYRIGDWYPFSHPNGLITDAKTTVCVGAALGMVSGRLNRLEGFRIDLGKMAFAGGEEGLIESTCKVVGPITPAGDALVDAPWFTAQDVDVVRDRYVYRGRTVVYELHAPFMLGMRQFDSESWPSTPLLKLDFASPDIARKYGGRELPLTLTLERRGLEHFKLLSAARRDGSSAPVSDLDIRLQTMVGEGHWLDTGVFVTSRG